MTSKSLELEGMWEDIVLQADKLAGHKVRVTVINSNDEEELNPSPEECFRQAWREMKEGKVRPISELWEGIDAE